MLISTCICRPPPTYPPGGEIWSPVLKPGGQFSVRTPHSCTIGLLQHGEVGNPDVVVAIHCHRPRPRKTATLKRRAGKWGAVRFQERHAAGNPLFVQTSSSLGNRQPKSRHRVSSVLAISTRWAMPSSPVPNRLVTQTLPWLSMLSPLLLIPVLKFSTLLGSAAEKRVTSSLPLDTQMRFCWSMAR